MCGSCFGGGDTQQQQTTTNSVPGWISGAGQDLYSRANSIAAQPYQPYGGQRVAGFSPDTQQSFNMVRGIAQQPFNPTPYMNPYWSSVADVTAQQALRNDDVARNSRSANAVSAGAFGGYRQGIEESESRNNLQTQLNNIYFQAGNNAYDRGVSSFFQDQNRGLTNASALSAQGTQQQQLQQQNLDTMYNDFQTQRDWPKTQLQFVADQFRGNPASQLNYGSSSTTTSNQPPGSMVGQIGSLGLGAYGLYKMFGQAKGGPVRGISHYRRGGAVRHYDQGGGVGSLTPEEMYAIILRDAAARRAQTATPPAGLPQVVQPSGALNPSRQQQFMDAQEQQRRQNFYRELNADRARQGLPPVNPDSGQPMAADRGRPDTYPVPSGGVGTATPGDFESASGIRTGTSPTVGSVGSYDRQPGLPPRPEDTLPNTYDPPQRLRPATALPGRGGVGQIPRSTQEASALPVDTREARFLRDMETNPQPSPAAAQSTQTIQDAMRDNIDRGEAILMTAAKWGEAAGRPGASAIGSLGEGVTAGLTNLREQRREQRDATRYDRQLGLQEQTLGESRRSHQAEEAYRLQHEQGETDRAREHNQTLERTAGAGAGAGEALRIREGNRLAGIIADPNSTQQQKDTARAAQESLFPRYPTAAAAQDARSDIAVFNRAAAEWQAGITSGSMTATPGTPEFEQARRRHYAAFGFTPDGQRIQGGAAQPGNRIRFDAQGNPLPGQ